MAKIKASCPQCGKQGTVPSEYAGCTVRCKCGGQIKVPFPPVPELGVRPVEPSPAVPDWCRQVPEPVHRPPVQLQPEPILYAQAVPQHNPSTSGFQCPFCKTNLPPRVESRISTAGWVLFVVLLLACFPLCVIGLFITENYRVCSSCGIKLG